MASVDYLKTTGNKRFVIEDSITKVTSDGEPHEMMTMIAVISGLLTAIVILTILVSLIGCRKQAENEEDKSDSGSTIRSLGTTSTTNDSATNSQRSSILTIYHPQRNSVTFDTKHECSCGKSMKKRNLEGNLNVAFAGNEFDLKDNTGKAKKKAHWQDEIREEDKPSDTAIVIEERF